MDGKERSQIIGLLRLLMLATAAIAGIETSATTIIPRDVKLTLRKFNVATGKEVWHSQEFQDVRPTHVELFRGRVVAYFRTLKPVSREYSSYSRPEDTRVYFFDSESGKEAPAFDTRDFVRTRDDALLAVSPGKYSSMLDERNELYLSNGWKSYGMKRLAWDGVRTIQFFQAGLPIRQNAFGTWQIVWTWTLPDGARDITSWETNILYVQYRLQNEIAVATLVAIKAGSDQPLWKFELPADVPALLDEFVLPPGVPQMRRGFDYVAGEKSIFVFGNGFLFEVAPQSGVVTRRSDINSIPTIKAASLKLNRAAVQTAGDNNVLLIGSLLEQPNVLLDVTCRPATTVKILRRDLLDARSVVAHDGSIYCFTAEELPKAQGQLR